MKTNLLHYESLADRLGRKIQSTLIVMNLQLSTRSIHLSIGWSAILAALMWGIFCQASNLRLIADEQVHARQIAAFMNGRWELHPLLTLPPLYHALMAIFPKVTGIDTLMALRIFHLPLALTFLMAFLSFCKKSAVVDFDGRLVKTLQTFGSPVFYILFFVLYADLPSLAAVFAMLSLTIAGRFRAAALFGVIATLMRQTNLIWCFLAFWWIIRSNSQGTFEIRSIWIAIRNAWPFVILFALAAIAIAWNRGFAIGDASMHKPSFNLSNLYFFFLSSALIFLPLNIAALPDLARFIGRRWWILLFVAGFFPVYWYTFNHDHPYNTVEFFLRNQLLMAIVDYPPWRALAYIAISCMALIFVREISRSKKTRELIETFAFSLPTIILPPLIEQRYYLVTFAIYLALRSPGKRWAEMTQIIYGFCLGGILIYHIGQFHFFL